MSHTEYHFGKLEPIPVPAGYRLEEVAAGMEKFRGIVPSERDSLEERFMNMDIFFYKDKLFKILDHVKADESDESHLYKNRDGSLIFAGGFYNGGGSFEEWLEYLLERNNI